MSAREWQPGDVAELEIAGEFVRGVVDNEGCWLIFGHSFFKGIRVGNDTLIQNARPLVVIDPEDREQVERLHDILMESEASVPATQDALREFANPTPPKPEEPTGLGAVVEDAEGREWIRYSLLDGCSWIHADMGPVFRGYDEIAVLKVLSEGVTE